MFQNTNSKLQEAMGVSVRKSCNNTQVQNLSRSTTKKSLFTIILYIQVILQVATLGLRLVKTVLIRASVITEASRREYRESPVSTYNFFVMGMTETISAHISLTKLVIHLFVTNHVPKRSIRIFVGLPYDYC